MRGLGEVSGMVPFTTGSRIQACPRNYHPVKGRPRSLGDSFLARSEASTEQLRPRAAKAAYRSTRSSKSMILADQQRALSKSEEGALWYVTNGEAVVGPVATDLLLRGITSARIPNDCMVAQENWGSWRALHQIRELSRVARRFTW